MEIMYFAGVVAIGCVILAAWLAISTIEATCPSEVRELRRRNRKLEAILREENRHAARIKRINRRCRTKRINRRYRNKLS